ncbi:MAG TPA: cytochrome c peroxidase [Azonexus sp.]|nr:cytochrome c peroxidase [Azonexus sp.]
MNSGLLDLIGIGIPALLIGLITLALMVHRELGPFAGLGRAGKWLLTGLFGLGFVAFGMKMAVAVAISAGAAEPLIGRAAYPAARDAEAAGEFVNRAPRQPERYVWQALPAQAPIPANNPPNPAKLALGKRLFDEKQLSGDRSLACSSCHDLYRKAGGDGRPTAIGIAAQVGARNTPTVWNAAFQSVLFWDGRAASLEAQAKGPILNPLEMGLPSPAEAERRLRAEPSYRADFAEAFGDEAITFERIAMALAAYERTLITPDAPFDRFVRGDPAALSQAQIRGMALFESVGCILCHRGPGFSDASLLGGQSPLRYFPATATPYEEKYRLLAENGGRGVWRVASLRNVALTGPWLHNGSVDTLEEVVRIMAAAQLGRSAGLMAWMNQDNALGKVDRSPLSEREVADIVAFLKSLSSEALVTGARAKGS